MLDRLRKTDHESCCGGVGDLVLNSQYFFYKEIRLTVSHNIYLWGEYKTSTSCGLYCTLNESPSIINKLLGYDLIPSLHLCVYFKFTGAWQGLGQNSTPIPKYIYPLQNICFALITFTPHIHTFSHFKHLKIVKMF